MFLCILQPPPGFDPQIPPPQIAVPSIPPPQQFEYGHGYGGDYLIKFVCVCEKPENIFLLLLLSALL